MKKIVLTGGGTAGHIIPNIALLPYLKKHFNEIYYFGTANGMEKNILKEYNFVNFVDIKSVKLIRKLTLKNLAIPFVLIKAIKMCKKYLKEINPDVVFAKGGYVSVPVVIAAHKLNIPIIAHESDITIGLANKIIYKYCKKMCFSFGSCYETHQKKGVFSGSPIRKEIFNGKKENVKSFINLDKNKKTILITGGSSGAKAINNLIFENVNMLTKLYNVIHIVGKDNINHKIKIKNYIQVDYANNIYDYFDQSDIVISRAGSNAIFELLAIKKPMILIPLPKECSRGDQLLNANYFEKNGYAKVIYQENLNIGLLKCTIETLLKNKEKYISTMKKVSTSNGCDIIIKEILSVCKN